MRRWSTTLDRRVEARCQDCDWTSFACGLVAKRPVYSTVRYHAETTGHRVTIETVRLSLVAPPLPAS